MSELIDLRAADPADLARIEAVYRRSARANPSAAAFLAARPEVLRIDPRSLSSTLVATLVPQGIVGFARVEPLETGSAELAALFVDPGHWRRGVGRRLLLSVGANLSDRAVGRLFVVAGREAAGFYRRLGFREVGPVTTAGGQATRLVLNLAERA